MSYIDESLAPSEVLIYRARFHWLQKAAAALSFTSFLGVAVAWLALDQSSAALIGSAAVAVIGAGIFVAMMVPLWTTEIGVTDHRFIFKQGWLRRTTDELQLISIEEVNLKQSVFGRLFGYGRLVLHGTGVNDIKLPTLADPVGLRRALQEGTSAAMATVVMGQPLIGTPQSTAAA
jgi:uncharacterized membrane protein YdbT with pleckstrin-like domain